MKIGTYAESNRRLANYKSTTKENNTDSNFCFLK